MTTLTKNVGAQYSLEAFFRFTMADAMVAGATGPTGALTNFKAVAGVFMISSLPPGAIVIGGEIVVNTVSNDSGTATIAVGDSASASRYLGATNIKAAARTVLVPTGYINAVNGIAITLANQNGDATTGDVSIRIAYILPGRVNENLKD